MCQDSRAAQNCSEITSSGKTCELFMCQGSRAAKKLKLNLHNLRRKKQSGSGKT